LNRLLNYFIMAKTSEGRAERTINDYKSYIGDFLQWIDEEMDVKSPTRIKKNMIREYINFMRFEKGWSPGTVNMRLRNIKAFYNFLASEDEEIIEKSPMKGIKLIKEDTDKVNALTAEQVKRLLEQPNKKTFPGFRDYVLMLMILDTGVRIGELMQLTLNDVDIEQRSIIIPESVAKTRKTRVLPLSSYLTKEVIKLISLRADDWPSDNLFTSYTGTALQSNSFRKRLYEYGIKAGFKTRAYPYQLRHTFATLYLTLKQGDAFSLQRLLGHSTLSMTRRYVNYTQSDISEQHAKFSPVQALLGKKDGGKRLRNIK